jgi:hypothetical protein
MSLCCLPVNTEKSRILKFLNSQSKRAFVKPETLMSRRSPLTEAIRIISHWTGNSRIVNRPTSYTESKSQPLVAHFQYEV